MLFPQLLLLLCVTIKPAQAQSEQKPFIRLLTSQIRQTFDAIRDYVANHPESPDSQAAALWTLQSAREFGWEVDASEIARNLLSENFPDVATQQLAREVLALGTARQGLAADSQAAFAAFLRGIRLRQPNQAADLAQSLALVWQLRGQPEQAKLVYEQLSGGFFLNEDIRSFAAARTARLELIGRAAPEFNEPDLANQAFNWSDARAKWTVIDFWATNCRPCLEELPRLKQRYAQFQPLGVELLGISFDDDAAMLQTFVTEQHLPWRQILDRKTAEEQYFVRLIPCLMIVDREGKVAAVDVRPSDLSWSLLQLVSVPTDE